LAPPAPNGVSPDALRDAWNVVAERSSLPVCRELNADRCKHAAQRLREKPDLAYWRSVITRIGQSSFCRGETTRGWRADFDFLLRRSTHLRVLEGKYDDRANGAVNPKTSGNVDALTRFVEAGKEILT